MVALKSILSSRVSKWMGHTIASIFLPRATVRHIPDIPGWGFVFQQDGALAHRARDTVSFLERTVPDFNSPIEWPPNSPDLNPVDYNIWSVLQEQVYPSTIANFSELDMRLINERGHFDRGCSYRPVAPSFQRLCPWSGEHFEHQA